MPIYAGHHPLHSHHPKEESPYPDPEGLSGYGPPGYHHPPPPHMGMHPYGGAPFAPKGEGGDPEGGWYGGEGQEGGHFYDANRYGHYQVFK